MQCKKYRYAVVFCNLPWYIINNTTCRLHKESDQARISDCGTTDNYEPNVKEKQIMKKAISLILVSVLAIALCISAFADNKIFGDTSTTPTYGNNMKKVSDITPTDGYTVYPIIANKSVTFYSVKDGKETAAKYKVPTVKPTGAPNGLIAQEDLAADNAVRAFAAPPYANLNGYQCMLNKDGIVEIKFHGTAINLGLTRLPNLTESPGMSAKITIDGKEFNTEAGVFMPEINDETHRQIDKRFFTSSELADGWHTVRIYSTSTEGSNSPQGCVYLDFFEVKETKAPDNPVTSDVTLGIAATAVCLSVIAVGVVIKRRNGR